MKKLRFMIFGFTVALLLASCNPVQDEEAINEEIIATQVSIILTETAIHAVVQPELTSTATPPTSPTLPDPEEEPTPTPTGTSTEAPTASPTNTPTSTPDLEDPAQLLGTPAWTYDFSGDDSPWDNVDTPQATFDTANGYLNLKAKANSNWHSWYLSSPTLKNAYVEATLQMSACSGADRFGLAVRGSSDGQQFYFLAITCDGRWGLFRMAEEVTIHTISGYQEAPPLAQGLTEPHRVGIWMQNNTFAVYIDGIKLGTVNDNTLTNAGYTGFLIAFANTPGFTVQVDQLKYWNVP